jgi:hypothetical protein
MNNMKVYGALSKARVMLQKSALKKTGKGHGFTYFELGDFLPRVNDIFDELKLSSFTHITEEGAKMVIVSSEDGSMAEFEVPFANFKGDAKRNLQEVQEMGGTITYLTRYLWVQALNIVEPDRVDRDKEVKQEETQPQQQRQAVQTQTSSVKTNNYTDDLVYWDGHSPIKEFDCFVVDQPDGSQITYKTMKSKKDGHLFGLAVIPAADKLPQNLKYYDFS